jgi:Na+/H+-dicarboxylate symporter
LAPSVAKILKIRKESKFAGFTLLWFSVTRVLAAIWAACFVSLILGLPFLPNLDGGGIWTAFLEVGGQLKHMLLTEHFFIAMYLSIAIGIVSYFIPPLYRLLQKGIDSVEAVGEHIGAWVPLFVFLIGAFIYGLPTKIHSEIPSEVLQKLGTVTIAGLNLNLTEEFGLVGVYVIEALMIGVGCFVWQIVQVLIVRKHVPGFTVKGFYYDYWIKVYPLAWSTASEAVSMPLNMFTLKRVYPKVQASVRKLVVGLGAYLNVNGTSMDVMIITAVVSTALGYPVSLLGLLISVPFIAIIGYGIPGIPGEAIIFLPLMLTIVNLPPELVTTFTAIFVAIQLGLPDSFRTGANVTDNGIYAVWLNHIFEKRFDK